MKGMIFTEFLALVAEKWNEDMVDDLIDNCDLPSGGAYTAVGTYDHTEMVALVSELSKRSGLPVPDLLEVYGEHLFGRLAAAYPALVNKADGLIDFLEGVENYIHVEVRKLYPDAELPSFEISRPGDGVLEMIYRSSRHLDDVCHGLIKGAVVYFESDAVVARRPLADGTCFVIHHP